MTITVCGLCGSTDERPDVRCRNCNPWSRVLTCRDLAPIGHGVRQDDPAPIYVSCGRDAEFEISDLSELRPDAAVTHACAGHIGSLLGSAADGDGRGPWQIRVLAPDEVGDFSSHAPVVAA